MYLEHKIISVNEHGSIAFSDEAATNAVRKIAKYVGQFEISDCSILYIQEFAQIVFLIKIKMDLNKPQLFTPAAISRYKATLKKQIQISLNMTGFNICLTYYN